MVAERASTFDLLPTDDHACSSRYNIKDFTIIADLIDARPS